MAKKRENGQCAHGERKRERAKEVGRYQDASGGCRYQHGSLRGGRAVTLEQAACGELSVSS